MNNETERFWREIERGLPAELDAARQTDDELVADFEALPTVALPRKRAEKIVGRALQRIRQATSESSASAAPGSVKLPWRDCDLTDTSPSRPNGLATPKRESRVFSESARGRVSPNCQPKSPPRIPRWVVWLAAGAVAAAAVTGTVLHVQLGQMRAQQQEWRKTRQTQNRIFAARVARQGIQLKRAIEAGRIVDAKLAKYDAAITAAKFEREALRAELEKQRSTLYEHEALILALRNTSARGGDAIDAAPATEIGSDGETQVGPADLGAILFWLARSRPIVLDALSQSAPEPYRTASAARNSRSNAVTRDRPGSSHDAAASSVGPCGYGIQADWSSKTRAAARSGPACP